MKKLRLILSMVCLSVFGLIAYQADAQQIRGGTPPTFLVKEAQALPAQAYVKMPVNFSISELLEEDEFNAKNGVMRPRIAKVISADITMENSGVWTDLPDGRRVWRVAVEAKNAKALLISYDEFYLPAGSQLFIYSVDKTHVLGYYDNTSNPRGKEYSSPLVAGDMAVFEYVEPLEPTSDKARLHITGIGYGYNNIEVVATSENVLNLNPNGTGNTYTCHVNIICPEGNGWREEAGTSVCQQTMLINGEWWICSGTLINNTANDKTPYIISAYHCGDTDYGFASASDLAKWQFYFFYESSNCTTGVTGQQGYYENIQALIGAEFKSGTSLDGGADGLLLKLIQPVPDEWIESGRIYFAGWDRRKIASQSGVGISHPKGNPKKIATYTSPATLTGGLDFGYPNYTAAQSHWSVNFVKTVTNWGRTEGGSSGSSLFNQNKLLVGTLSGSPSTGNASCTATSGTFIARYGALHAHWDALGNSPETQMKTWLDPVCGGEAEVCPPYPDFLDMTALPFDFKAEQTNLYALESTVFSIENKTCGAFALRIDSVKWEFESGTPPESTDEQPEIAYETATGSPFDVKLTIYSKDIANDNDTVFEIIKTDYITVTDLSTTVPMANFAVLENGSTQLYFVDGGTTTGEPTVSSTGSSSTFVKATYSGTGAVTGINGWAKVNSDNYLGGGYSGSSNDYYFRFTNQSTGEIIMYNRNGINLSSVPGAVLSFQFKSRAYNASYPNDVEGLRVVYRSAVSDTWTDLDISIPFGTISTIDPGSNNPPTTTQTVWKSYECNLPNLSSTYYIGFIGIGNANNYGRGLGIDNIQIMDKVSSAHVTLWEGDAVEYVNLASGNPILYKYEFEGGDPATSTSNASIVNVRYDTEGLYDASQAVRNTLGADTMVRADYVEVIRRILKTDTALITADCNSTIDEYITLTANKDWVATYPVWMQVSPSSGSPVVSGVSEDFLIHVTVPAQTKYIGKNDKIVFRTDDYLLTTKVTVKQASASPTGLTAVRQGDTDAVVNWDVPACIVYEKSMSECDVVSAGNGDFEELPQEWMSFTEGEGPGWLWDYPAEEDAHSGNGSVLAFSWYNESYNADNWLVTPKLKITEDYHVLTYYVMAANPNYVDSYEVYLSTASDITSVTDFDVVIKELSEAEEQGFYARVDIDLSEYAGQEVYIAFRHFCTDKYALLLDDISGLEVASCAAANEAESEILSSAKTNRMLSINNAKISRRKVENKEVKKENKLDADNNNRQLKDDINKNVQKISTAANTDMHENVLQSINTPMITGVDDIRKCGDYNTAYGFATLGYNIDGFKVAIKLSELDAVEYSCSELKAVTMLMYSPLNIELFVQRGDSVIYTQSVPSSTFPGGWSPVTIQLTTPVPLAGEGDLYIGYTTPVYATGIFPYTVDAGPYVEGGAEIFFAGQWFSFYDLVGLNYNLYIIGHTELEGTVGVYNLYRQRKLNGVFVGEPELLVRDFEGASYTDENIVPGGEYCYWVTLKSKGIESCASDTSCVFILYQQTIDVTTPINKTYGDEPFKIDEPATNGYLIKSSADDIDYFTGGILPVKLEILSGTSITLNGSESNYTATINSAGSTVLRATQAGIPDTLLADTAEIQVNINKKDLKVIADDKTREEGQDNPTFTVQYDSFITGESVNNLDVLPTATCVAGVLAPIGEYPITVNVGVDKNYNLIPVSGILYVVRSEKRVNTFTPYDADDINDSFMPDYNLKIFNRYGVLIYETKTPTQKRLGWDGRFQNSNQLVNPGVYYYIVYDDNGKAVRKGSVNVVKK